MSTISVRRASKADAGLLERIFRTSFTDTFGHLYAAEDLHAFLAEADLATWQEELADPDMAVLIAEAGGEPAGFARVGPGSLPIDKPPGALELRQLYLLPAYKGTGMGPLLLDWAISEARGRGAPALFLSVYADNHRAKRLYTRYGFEEVGAFKFMVGRHPDDERIMRLWLEL
jgi:ribosomal protein S18 acetylase RimI-like enzyme